MKKSKNEKYKRFKFKFLAQSKDYSFLFESLFYKDYKRK